MIKSKNSKIYKKIKDIIKNPYKYNACILEGYKSKLQLEKEKLNMTIYSSSKSNYTDIADYIIDDKLFSTISSTVNTQGILIETDIVRRKFDDGDIVILDRIQDPGNIGTIIRSANAFGFNNILSLSGSCSIYNQKVLRASTGSILSMNIREKATIDDILNIKEKGYKILASTIEQGEYINNNDKKAIVIGNESNGISKDILDISDYKISIKMLGNVQSLNAAVAASILMHKYMRD